MTRTCWDCREETVFLSRFLLGSGPESERRWCPSICPFVHEHVLHRVSQPMWGWTKPMNVERYSRLVACPAAISFQQNLLSVETFCPRECSWYVRRCAGKWQDDLEKSQYHIRMKYGIIPKIAPGAFGIEKVTLLFWPLKGNPSHFIFITFLLFSTFFYRWYRFYICQTIV